MLVTIICPIYNPNIIFLKECINSILSQTFTDFELIITDNGNFDLSELQSDYRIKYFKCKEIGIFNNINNGILNAKGKYVQVICQDDILEKTFLEHQLEGFNLYPNAKLIFSSYFTDYEYLINKNSNIRKGEFRFWASKIAVNYFFSGGCLPGNLSTVMFRRDLTENIGYFNIQYPFAGDFEYWQKIIFNYPIIYATSNLIFIRQHKNQASNTLKQSLLLNDLQKIYTNFLNSNFQLNTIRNILYINKKICFPQYRKFIKDTFYFKSEFRSLLLLNKYPFSILICLLLFFIPQRLYEFKR
jgi:glycosyltransferase involved in cell wall biosynthesis